MVVRHAHRTIALVVGYTGSVRAVDWDLEIVGSQSVSMCVRIREETALKNETQHFNIPPPVRGTNLQWRWMTMTWGKQHLQHFVGTWLDAWWHVAGVKGYLLHFCKVVAWVPIENHLAHWDQRVFLMGPNLKDNISKPEKNIPFSFLKKSVNMILMTINASISE